MGKKFIRMCLVAVFSFYSVASFANYPLSIKLDGSTTVVIEKKPKNVVVYDNPTQWYVITGGYTSVLNTVNELNARW